jgi:hypothetical protein
MCVQNCLVKTCLEDAKGNEWGNTSGICLEINLLVIIGFSCYGTCMFDMAVNTIISLLLLIVLRLILLLVRLPPLTAVELSPSGSRPYTTTDRTGKNKHAKTKQKVETIKTQ